MEISINLRQSVARRRGEYLEVTWRNATPSWEAETAAETEKERPLTWANAYGRVASATRWRVGINGGSGGLTAVVSTGTGHSIVDALMKCAELLCVRYLHKRRVVIVA